MMQNFKKIFKKKVVKNKKELKENNIWFYNKSVSAVEKNAVFLNIELSR